MRQVLEVKPPGRITYKAVICKVRREFKIFLAGSIDNGEAEDWQSKVVDYFSWNPTSANGTAILRDNIVIFNPRREYWNPDLKQEFSEPMFYQQVNWELNAMEQADLIIMNILPNSKSPISLMELGLYAKSGKLKVCCPEGFYRKGNVEVLCDRYGIPMYETLEDLLKSIEDD